MKHVIDWPGGENMSREQAIRAMGIPETVFDRLLKLGILPEPEGDNKKVHRWKWQDVYAVSQIWGRVLKLIDAQGAGQE